MPTSFIIIKLFTQRHLTTFLFIVQKDFQRQMYATIFKASRQNHSGMLARVVILLTISIRVRLCLSTTSFCSGVPAMFIMLQYHFLNIKPMIFIWTRFVKGIVGFLFFEQIFYTSFSADLDTSLGLSVSSRTKTRVEPSWLNPRSQSG